MKFIILVVCIVCALSKTSPSGIVNYPSTKSQVAAVNYNISYVAQTQLYQGIVAREALAGFISALATVPTSISYASIIGFNPLVGIWSSVILGAVMALIGGCPGVIPGAAGIVAIPLSKQVALYGYRYTSATVLFTSVLEFLFGLSRAGKYINIVTEPVMSGFLNAFAIFLLKSQVSHFSSKVFFHAIN